MRHPPSFYATLPRIVQFCWLRAPSGLQPIFAWSHGMYSRVEGMAGGSPVVVR